MSDTTEYGTETETTEPETNHPRDEKTGRFTVRLSHPDDRKRIVFSSIDETRARNYLVNNFPRGSTAYLEKPDGTFESHEAERANEKGQGAESWAEFDPEAWQPPEQQAAPGETDWADRTG